MINSKNLKTITDMRKDADGLLKLAAQTQKPIGILKNNKLEAYLLDAKVLEAIEEMIEDYEDAKIIEERKSEELLDFDELWQNIK